MPASLSGVTAIAAGTYHGLGLRSDGAVVAWGSNQYGQVGVPPTLPPARAVAAGGNHSLALLRDGTVAAWGSNSSGQTAVPAGLQNVVAIAAGTSHYLALLADGTLVGWGYSADGRAAPPAGTGRILTLSAGGGHNLALTEAATIVPPVILSPATAVTNAAGTAGTGLLFSHRIVATGSPASYSAAGLPAGLTLDTASGIISGVATQPGEFAVILSAQNAAGTGTQQFRLWVQGAPRFLSLPAVLPLSVTQNLQNYAANIPTLWAAAGLPPGLSINMLTGAITGGTTRRGVYAVHLVFSNAYGQGEADWQVDVTPVVRIFPGMQWGGLGKVTGVSASNSTSVILKDDGSLVQNPSYLQSYMPQNPGSITGAVAGPNFLLALRSEGTLAGWPNSTQTGPFGIDVPADLSGVVGGCCGEGTRNLSACLWAGSEERRHSHGIRLLISFLYRRPVQRAVKSRERSRCH